MAKRIFTSIVGLPILIAIVYIGGIPLQLGLLFLSCVGLSEFYSTLRNSDVRYSDVKTIEFSIRGKLGLARCLSVNYISYIFTAFYYLLLPQVANTAYFFILITMFIISLMVVMVFFHGKVNIMDCAETLFGFFYTSFLLSFIYLIRVRNLGEYFVWLVFITAFGCDSFAYFIGRAFGRHKLAPELSPNKTIEGAVGGVAGAGLLSMLFGMLISKMFHLDDINAIIYFALVGVVGALFSTFGDLAASSVKRYTGIKDFGKIFPGHGGVLDRFDSVIFASPMIYMAILLLQNR
ncbi:MAG: phosphatidate cytidylyltransferase [Clostridiales bacterium]|jgi:phosphatidate cytidylyltransferase|nr:phosphatidate cytidylyltransferase [Clostridiales bacterium]